MDPVSLSRLIAGTGTPAAAWHGDERLARVPETDIDSLAAPGTRVVVVAPHPDDEVLACGGLLHLLARRGAAPLLVAVTDGEGSHPGSPAWPRERLRQARIAETRDALACLGLASPAIERLGVADGGVAAAVDDLAARVAAVLRPGDIVLTTWRYDGHPDHEACARACAAAARARGARLLEAPVWGWHWSAPHDEAMPLAHAFKLPLAPEIVARKRAALACFHSQLNSDASTGAAAILPPFAVERILHPFELYFHDH